MESFTEIKSLWQTDELDDLPLMVEIEKVIRQYVKKSKRNNTIVILSLAGILTVSALLIRFADYNLWSTYSGMIIFMAIALYMILLKTRRQNKLADLETLSNNDFLSSLEKEEKQTCHGKSKNQTLLFIIWAIGFSFYIYEFIAHSIGQLLLGYGMLTILILSSWFIYRPYMARRYYQNIQKTVEHIHKLKSQINEND